MVIAIISLLVSILLPSLQKAKDLARNVVCLSNLKGISLGFVLYAHENDNWLPPSLRYGWGGKNPISWFERLSEYCGIGPVWEGWDNPTDAETIFSCPAHENPVRPLWMSYGYIFHYGFLSEDGLPALGPSNNVADPRQLDKFIHPSRTILLFDLFHGYPPNPQADGYNLFDSAPAEDSPEYRHPNETANFLYIDGHISPSDRDEVILWGYDEDHSIVWGNYYSYVGIP